MTGGTIPPQHRSKAVRYDSISQRIMRGDAIVAMALQLGNGRWALCDTSDRRLTAATYARPADAARAFDEMDAAR